MAEKVAHPNDLPALTAEYLRLRAVNAQLLEAVEKAQPKLRHETDACAVVNVGTCAKCSAVVAIEAAK